MSYYQLFEKIFEKAAKKMCFLCKDFISQGSKILDFGCGSGIVGATFAQYFNSKIIGVDIVDQRIRPISFLKIDGKNLPFPNDYFDVALVCFVLHHVVDPIEVLKEIKRVSKIIIICEDLPEGIFGKIYCFLHWISWNLFFGKSPKFNFHTTKEWEEVFETLGLKLVSKKDFLIKRKIFILKK
jgi:ubiquinone/menaquinone biosynthesis C-methylase UbiE